MKKNIKIAIGLVFVVAIVSFNIGFVNEIDTENSISLSSLQSFASASAEEDPYYGHCYVGNLNNSYGYRVLYCGTCYMEFVDIYGDGYCRVW